jgi:hypothetical protein
MRMKHRWTAGVLLVAALTLTACAPTDSGADDPTPSPTTEVTESTDAPTDAPESETPEPAEYEQDEY